MNHGLIIVEQAGAVGAPLWNWATSRQAQLACILKGTFLYGDQGSWHEPWSTTFARSVGVPKRLGVFELYAEFKRFEPHDLRRLDQMMDTAMVYPRFPAIVAPSDIEDAKALAIVDGVWPKEDEIFEAVSGQMPVAPILQDCPLESQPWAYLVGLCRDLAVSYFLCKDACMTEEFERLSSGSELAVIERW